MSRCNSKNVRSYKYYGAKGIKVEYSKREFIQWFLDNYEESDKKVHIGRIDHSKNYSFDNIEIQSARENILERIDRCGPPSDSSRKKVLIKKNKVLFCTALSKTDAKKIVGLRSKDNSYFNGRNYKEFVMGEV